MLLNTIWMALTEIRRNAMRSLLTMLGVIIGVGSVIALVTIGDGATAKVRENISSLGNNLLIIVPESDSRHIDTGGAGKPFTLEDAEAIEREIGGIALVAPSSSRPAQLIFGARNFRTVVTGTTASYLAARNYEVERGGSVESVLAGAHTACVLGATPARELFGHEDPVGKVIRVGRTSCDVVAVLKSKGASGAGGDNDDVVLMPLRAFQLRISGNADVTTMFATAREGRSTTALRTQIERLLRERRRLDRDEENDFSIHDMQEIIRAVSTTTSMLTGLLAAIAAVSLLVGGIGIMNIMLVSVTERTKEIGTRLAIGALARDVLLQFLIEAVTLSAVGGLIGIVFGLLLGFGVTRALEFPLLVSSSMVALSFGFAVGVGVLFGFLPARKAARLNPIDALRHE